MYHVNNDETLMEMCVIALSYFVVVAADANHFFPHFSRHFRSLRIVKVKACIQLQLPKFKFKFNLNSLKLFAW